MGRRLSREEVIRRTEEGLAAAAKGKRLSSRGRAGSWVPGLSLPPLRDFYGTQPTEEMIGIRVTDECRLRARHASPELGRLYHVPNGGHRSKAAAGKMRAQGQRPGVLDYCLPVPRRGYHGLYVELKKHDGDLSADQKLEVERLTADGYLAVVAWGAAAMMDVLLWYIGGGDGPPPWEWPAA